MKTQRKANFIKRPASAPAAPSTSNKSSDPTLPVLKHEQGPDSAIKYLQWRKAIGNKCSALYGELGKIFITLEDVQVQEIIPDLTLNDANDPGGYQREEIKQDIKARRAKLLRFEQDKPKIFALIWNQLSVQSERAVERDIVTYAMNLYEEEVQMFERDGQDFIAETRRRQMLVNAANAAAAVAAAPPVVAPAAADDNDDDDDDGNAVAGVAPVIPPAVVNAAPDPLNGLPPLVAPIAPVAIGTTPQILEEFKLIQNPVQLLQSIHRTHIVHTTAFRAGNMIAARENYSKLWQGEKETLADFRERFEAAIEGLEGVGEVTPSEETQAQDFVKRMHRKFATFKAQLQNNAVMGISTYPASIMEVCDLAANFMIVVPAAVKDAGEYGTVMLVDEVKTPKKKYEGKGAKKAKPVPVKENDKKKPSRPCRVCEGNHYDNDCPLIAEAKKLRAKGKHSGAHADDEDVYEAVVNAVIVAHVQDHEENCKDIVIDTCSSIHLFGNKELLQNVKPNTKRILVKGIDPAGGGFIPKHVGTCAPFGDVYLDDRVGANILSFAKLTDDHKVEYKDGMFNVLADGRYYQFQRFRDIYACADVMMSTVKDNEQRYTPREVQLAKEAKQLIRRLGYPNAAAVINLLNSGSLLNCPVSAQDVRRAYSIYGPDLASVYGKYTHPKPNIVSTESIESVAAEEREQTLHVDIMSIRGELFYISVSTPLGLTSVDYLPSKSSVNIEKITKQHIAHYKSHGFHVTQLSSDGERTLGTLANASLDLGVKWTPVPTGTHNPIVERKIRTVKERVRGILRCLPYKMPMLLLKHLVFHCVVGINMMPTMSVHNTANKQSPREKYYGKKIDYQRDLRAEFGEYCLSYDPNIAVINSMQPRAHECLTLYTDGNGGMRMLNLATLRVVSRCKWTTIPLTENTISRIEGLSPMHLTGVDVELQADILPVGEMHIDDFGADDIVAADAAATVSDSDVTVDVPVVVPATDTLVAPEAPVAVGTLKQLLENVNFDVAATDTAGNNATEFNDSAFFFLTTYFRIKSYTYIYMQLYNYHENVHLTTTHCYYANTLSSAAVSPHHRATFRD